MNPSTQAAHRRAQARYQKTAKGRATHQKTHQKERDVHADRVAARKMVSNAVRDGRLIRPMECSACGIPCEPEAHHHKGYGAAHSLSVQWLCGTCHRGGH